MMLSLMRQRLQSRNGAEAISKLLEEIDLDAMAKELHESQDKQRTEKIRATRRLDVVESFRKSGNSPAWMIMKSSLLFHRTCGLWSS